MVYYFGERKEEKSDTKDAGVEDQDHIYICALVLLILPALTYLFRERAKKADTLQWRKKRGATR